MDAERPADDLYQIKTASGMFHNTEYTSTSYKGYYEQTYSYDKTGNILNKTSSKRYTKPEGDTSDLSYELDYSYYENSPHQAEVIGNMYYLYDSNGNVTEERKGGHSEEGIKETSTVSQSGNITQVNRAFGFYRHEGSSEEESVYKRTYSWDSENRLTQVSDETTDAKYKYDSEGIRTNKLTNNIETLYFDKMWLIKEEDGDYRQSKNIYVGDDRLVTRLGFESDPSTGYEDVNTYYYHSDHLGSANLVTDKNGDIYEHIEYTLYDV